MLVTVWCYFGRSDGEVNCCTRLVEAPLFSILSCCLSMYCSITLLLLLVCLFPQSVSCVSKSSKMTAGVSRLLVILQDSSKSKGALSGIYMFAKVAAFYRLMCTLVATIWYCEFRSISSYGQLSIRHSATPPWYRLL